MTKISMDSAAAGRRGVGSPSITFLEAPDAMNSRPKASPRLRSHSLATKSGIVAGGDRKSGTRTITIDPITISAERRAGEQVLRSLGHRLIRLSPNERLGVCAVGC